MLGSKPGSSARSVSSLNFCANSQVLKTYFFIVPLKISPLGNVIKLPLSQRIIHGFMDVNAEGSGYPDGSQPRTVSPC